jgi:Secretion system C-terminal sorting domain
MLRKISLLLLSIFTVTIYAQTVNIEGNPYGGNPYATITAAITASTNPKDVILISGIHTESITISKSLTLKGSDPTKDIIQASATPATATTRVITMNNVGTPIMPLNIAVENLGVRHGNGDANTNGGGIFADKITGLVTLKNLIIENNNTARNGGGIATDGANVDIIECTIQNNVALLDGGGIIASSNNGSGINSVINFKQSLMDKNEARNGGGMYINGNSTFGNQFTVSVNVENSTISNNAAKSPSTGNGGGAIFCLVTGLSGTTPVAGNINLKLVHATIYNNTHANATRSGLQFLGPSGQTNFSAFNSIIVGNNEAPLTTAINFNTMVGTTNIVNCILGALNNGSTNAIPMTLIDDVAKNNLSGRTAMQAGLDVVAGLQDLGGKSKVFALSPGSRAINFCLAPTGITIPIVDQRGTARTENFDAGAFEFVSTSSIQDQNYVSAKVNVFPNPTNGAFSIAGIDINQIKLVKVYSILGQLERVFDSQSELNVSDLTKGTHIIVIDTEHQKIVNRLVIQ